MKLSMSFAQTIIDEVQSGAELYEVQLLLNKFLAAKVEKAQQNSISINSLEVEDYERLIDKNDLLTDN